MEASESYWIRTYFSGAQGNDVVMKRKPKTLSVEDAFKNSDFHKRFSRDLLDHRYPVEFTLNENKRYEDDQDEVRYEIKQIDDKEYLVFIFSLVKVAFAMDEAQLFKGVKVNFELRSDRLSSFSKVNSFGVSMLANMVMILIFFGILYALFPILRQTIFGFKHIEKVEKPEEYKK
ncbi:UNKNOWN [Stylonychia lemnae]|uniref:Uncharacterized protein n=1 Tax=Stylonychia lemnae TaxID=5949 RepID=A0A078APB3_STYLE|nr:UNKNOWN [Stylonychia lemnae]|eukprot:CDW84210.1 UNKNOWN [Stylonychia lemnae]